MTISGEIHDVCLLPMARHSADIRLATSMTFSPIRPSHNHPFLAYYTVLILHSLNLLSIFFIYPCSRALQHSLALFLSHPTMVSTRPKNKKAHPAAPVMSNAAKVKAGIPTKKRPKRTTKDDTIRELQAQIAALKDPSGEPFSKEPLVRNLF